MAKRLVSLTYIGGGDVVVNFDFTTELNRAFNAAHEDVGTEITMAHGGKVAVSQTLEEVIDLAEKAT